MAEPRQHHAEHTLTVSAPPAALYRLVSDVSVWPAVFGPTVHVHHLEHGADSERFQLWATVNGEVVTWVSQRAFDERQLRITFRQERSRNPLIGSMGGEWQFLDLGDGRTEVVLRHHFTAADDEQSTVDLINRALDTNSARELGALAAIAELGHPVEDVVFSFTDTVEFDGPVEAAYEFVNRADLWAERLPHVARVGFTEPSPGVQTLEMDTRTADGSTHTTESIRVCRPGEWIAYKQLRTPKLMTGHSGLWSFGTDEAGRPVVTARHTVAVNPAAVEEVLGAGKTLADARDYLRDALGRNSTATMSHAARHAASASVTVR